MSTRVVHITDRIEGAVYIGRSMSGFIDIRGGPLANPFTVKKHGLPEAIRLFDQFIRRRLREGHQPTIDALIAARGRPLACWCRHDGEPRTEHNACHGDVLVELLDRYTDEELRAMGGAS